MNKKIKKEIYVLILIIGILIILDIAYFLFIEEKIASNDVTDKQVKKELERISELNQNLDYSSVDISVPWVVFGIYNGRELAIGFSCGETCPEGGEYKLIYTEIGSVEKCEEIGGKPLYDSSEEFSGCEPIVN